VHLGGPTLSEEGIQCLLVWKFSVLAFRLVYRLGAMLSSTITSPLEVVKIRLQAQNHKSSFVSINDLFPGDCAH
jgi:hypothetical protein